ncbi:MAG: tRNA 2-thiouridine(34) synthase MnmA [Oscillospiraceae bacterium]|jgi:tRNA-specific 2-thiouridylase
MKEMKKVVVGMSGGVDSTVTALLLQQQGLEPVGVTLRLWGGEENAQDAAQVCKALGIEHRTLDLRERFLREVVEPFANEYTAGRTPNPCVRCNRRIKFTALWEEASKLDAGVATGHYARVLRKEKGTFLAKGTDLSKEQSYVLWDLPRWLVPYIYLPLGDKTKKEIRAIAAQAGLSVAQKADSQDICFVPDGDYAAVLESLRPGENPPGRFLDEEGRTLGEHRGLWHYTVGQRKGLGISFGKPMFVKKICGETGDVVLAENDALFRSSLTVDKLNWLDRDKLEQPEEFEVKLRYGAQPVKALVIPEETGARIELQTPHRAITPGQSAVFYQGEILCGGGIIRS